MRTLSLFLAAAALVFSSSAYAQTPTAVPSATVTTQQQPAGVVIENGRIVGTTDGKPLKDMRNQMQIQRTNDTLNRQNERMQNRAATMQQQNALPQQQNVQTHTNQYQQRMQNRYDDANNRMQERLDRRNSRAPGLTSQIQQR